MFRGFCGELKMSEKVNWIEDPLAESVMNHLVLKWQVDEIDQRFIDLKTSRSNTARPERLDDDHADAISKSIIKGGPVPMIVLRRIRKQTNGPCTYVIAGGNHRDEACRIAGELSRMCYVVECTNSEFTILCRMLNTVVGKGSDKNLRAKHAADAVSQNEMSTKDAAIAFNISAAAINDHIRLEKAESKLAAYGVSNSKAKSIPVLVKKRLLSIQADAVLEAAIELATLPHTDSKEVARAISSAAAKNTEKEQLAYLKEKIQQESIIVNKPVKSKKRSSFLRAISAVEGALSTATSLDDLEVAEDKKEVRERCKLLANKLNCL